MKIIKIYSILIALVVLFSQCQSEEDPDLYQVYYQKTTDSTLFVVEPRIIDLSDSKADTIRFSYKMENSQKIVWDITLEQTKSGAQKKLTFDSKELLPSEHFWVFDSTDSQVAFKKNENIRISVNADIAFDAGEIKFK